MPPCWCCGMTSGPGSRSPCRRQRRNTWRRWRRLGCQREHHAAARNQQAGASKFRAACPGHDLPVARIARCPYAIWFRRSGAAMDKTLHDRLTGWRRHLHANPDLTRHEARTAAFVQERLQELGIPCVGGVGGHGVVGTITRGASNRSVGLRADMDALPIQETTGVPYASRTSGVMHACGHDGHTVSLLGAAALLAADTSWSGTVQLVFQPAEEGGGGALSMIGDSLFDRFPMERVFSYHNWPGLEAGTVAVHDGPVMAAGNRLFFTVTGHGGHAALPHRTRDPMVAAAHLLLALQSIVSRSVDPLDSAVVTIAMIQAGSA